MLINKENNEDAFVLMNESSICAAFYNYLEKYWYSIPFVDREKEEVIRQLKNMAQSKDIIFEWDIKTGHIYHSDTFRQKFGFESPSEHFPEAVIEAGGVPESDEAVFLQTYRKIAGGEPYAEGEFRVYDSSHYPLWCRSRVSLIVDENGAPSKGIGILMDIDEEMREKEKIMRRLQKTRQM